MIAGALAAGAGVKVLAREHDSAQKARMAIEKLHQQDAEATLSGISYKQSANAKPGEARY